MTSTAYYNEIDPFAADWLELLMAADLIAPGIVDRRSIVDVQPEDLRGFKQCHFFAGIGGWSAALRLAGVPDSTPIWTGSCPCQPFSVAGKRQGTADARHLWPHMARLIAECHPSICFGEQVASCDGRDWLAGVRTDLEGMGYAVGAADLCAASAGAPHIRQRLYWMANMQSQRLREERESKLQQAKRPSERSDSSRMANAEHSERRPECEKHSDTHGWNGFGWCSDPGRMANATDSRRDDKGQHGSGSSQFPARFEQRSPWSDSYPLSCLDGKVRRVPSEPFIFPLAHGISNRVGMLRGAGNAICVPLAAQFIKIALDTLAEIG